MNPVSERLEFAVVGKPVSHSRSPLIHDAAFRAAGIDARYRAIEADVGEWPAIIARVRNGRLQGVNATMPLKSMAYRHANVLTREARLSKSVNTIRLVAGDIEGHSTDVVAAREVLAGIEGDQPLHVIGSGGAARAVLAAREHRDAYLSGRSQAAVASCAALFGGGVTVVDFGVSVAGSVVVNCTPLGIGEERIPSGVIEVASAVVDLPYGEVPSDTIATAEALGKPFVDGLTFLVEQAVAAFEWWFGRPAPRDVMTAAARKI